MFGIQSLLTGLSGFFTHIGIGVVAILIAYALYTHLKSRHTESRSPDFSHHRRAREQRMNQVQTYTSENTLRLQKQSGEILTGIQEQQAHFGSLIQDFAQNLQTIHTVGEDLDQTSSSLRDIIITPLNILLERMQTQYQLMSDQISQLASALTSTTSAMVEREQELAQIVKNLREIESSAQTGMSQLNSGLDAIVDIRNLLEQKTKRIQSLEKTNDSLTESLVRLSSQTQRLAELNERQERLIELLRPSANTHPLPNTQKRSSLSPYSKHSNYLFKDVIQRGSSLHLSPSGFRQYPPYGSYNQSNGTK